MKKLRLPILSIVMAIIMSVSMTAFAEEIAVQESGDGTFYVYVADGFIYGVTTYDGGLGEYTVICDYIGNLDKITIPNYIQGHKVDGLGYISNVVDTANTGRDFTKQSFDGNSRIKEITIPDGLEGGIGGFNNCENLRKVTIYGDSSIITNGFNDCPNLEEVVFASNNAVIYGGFSNCPKLKIYGNSGSSANTFADSNGIPFAEISTISQDTSVTTPTEQPQTQVNDKNTNDVPSANDNTYNNNNTPINNAANNNVTSPKTGNPITPVDTLILLVISSAAAVCFGRLKEKE